MTSITRRPSADGLSVWQIDLDAPLAPGAAVTLSAEENARANNFVLDRNRRYFVAAHAALRQILANHTQGHPASLLFSAGSFGKPLLVRPGGVQFNLSHNQSTALVAIGTLFPLGVDIELVRPLRDALTLAEEHFTAAEYDALKSLSGTSRDQAFLTCWTRKEACLKAFGLGLHLPTDSFEVGVTPDARTVKLPTSGRIAHIALTPVDTAIGSVASLGQWLNAPPSHRQSEPRQELFA